MLKTSRTLVILSILLCATLLFNACAPQQSSDAEQTTGEQTAATSETGQTTGSEDEIVTMTIGTTDLWDTANPLAGFSWGARPLLYDRLTSYDTMTTVKPGLAKSWEVSEDYLTWTFHLEEGVKFHDGTPCTAEEIAWVINWYIESGFPAMEAYVSGFKDAVAVDPTTLQINLEHPILGMLTARVIFIWIVPPSVWEGKTYDEAVSYMDLDAMYGTGPYKAVEYVEGEYLIMDAFEDYWRGKPTIDRVVIRLYATSDALTAAIQSGEIDLTAVPYQAVEALQGTDNIEVVSLPGLETHYLIINSYENGTQHEALRNLDVRKAIAHAVDKTQIINIAYMGFAEPATIPAPTGFGDLHNPNIVDYDFDIAEANTLMDQAGYLDTDGDGLREGADGQPLEFRMVTDAGVIGVRMLEIIADGLSQIGITAYPTEIDDIASLYPDYDFDLAIWSWGWDPDIEESLRAYTCAEVPDGWNDAGYCDPAYDELYAQQGDPNLSYEERRDIIWEMQQMFFDAVPYVSLTYPEVIWAYRSDRFTNFVTDKIDMIWYPESLLQVQIVNP